MSITEPTREQIRKRNEGRIFTFNEAIEYVKFIDKNFPTGQNTVNWVNAKTGKRVSIGYT